MGSGFKKKGKGIDVKVSEDEQKKIEKVGEIGDVNGRSQRKEVGVGNGIKGRVIEYGEEEKRVDDYNEWNDWNEMIEEVKKEKEGVK